MSFSSYVSNVTPGLSQTSKAHAYPLETKGRSWQESGFESFLENAVKPQERQDAQPYEESYDDSYNEDTELQDFSEEEPRTQEAPPERDAQAQAYDEESARSDDSSDDQEGDAAENDQDKAKASEQARALSQIQMAQASGEVSPETGEEDADVSAYLEAAEQIVNHAANDEQLAPTPDDEPQLIESDIDEASLEALLGAPLLDQASVPMTPVPTLVETPQATNVTSSLDALVATEILKKAGAQTNADALTPSVDPTKAALLKAEAQQGNGSVIEPLLDEAALENKASLLGDSKQNLTAVQKDGLATAAAQPQNALKTDPQANTAKTVTQDTADEGLAAFSKQVADKLAQAGQGQADTATQDYKQQKDGNPLASPQQMTKDTASSQPTDPFLGTKDMTKPSGLDGFAARDMKQGPAPQAAATPPQQTPLVDPALAQQQAQNVQTAPTQPQPSAKAFDAAFASNQNNPFGETDPALRRANDGSDPTAARTTPLSDLMAKSSPASSTLSARGNAAPQPYTQVTLQQISLTIGRMAKEGMDRLKLQLTPAELGRVEIQMAINHDKKVKTKISADNQSTLDLLKQDQTKLIQALQDAGLDANSVDMEFTLAEQSDDNKSDQQQTADNANSPLQSGPELAQDEETQADTEEHYLIGPGRLNMRV